MQAGTLPPQRPRSETHRMGTREPGRRVMAAALAAAGICAAAGCGSSSDDSSATAKAATVDRAPVESAITKKFSSDAAKVTKAKCPDDVAVKAGDTFKCDASWSNGATGKVQVTQE